MESQSETTQTVSALKLSVLKTWEYDVWSMRMEQYLTFTDHALWEVIVNGDSVSPIALASASVEGPIPPKTAKQKLARKNELKVKSTLMLVIPNEHLLKFHACKDAKSLWEAIKNRFGGNKESKKMQKTILKQNYENFTASCQEGLDKTYDRFQKLISQLEIHGEVISQEDLNMKLLRSLPSLAIDTDDLEEIDLKWQVVMLTIRVKRVPKNQGNRNRDAPRRKALVDISTTNALVVQNGIGGYDWSFQVEEGITNFSLMAYTSQGYQMRLESLEARIVVHEKNEVLEEALKEKDDLKLKLENFEESSKNLTKLINSQITAKDKTGLGFHEEVNESEVLDNVFDIRESNGDDNPVNDRFKKVEGYHAVPPPYTGNYMPSRPDLSFARPKSDQTKPKFTKINFVKSGENVKSVNKENTHRQVEHPRKSQSLRDNRRNWNGMMTQKLRNGFEFIKKAYFVCGSFNHLIKDCDFQDNKMVEKLVLNNKRRVTGQREVRPVWINAPRVNHQNKLTHPHLKRNFVPTSVGIKSRQVPVNTANQSSLRASTSINPQFPDEVYKVEKALYGLHQAPRAWYETLSTYLLENGFRRVKTTSIPIETNKALLKDEEAEDMDVYLYRLMIGSLMYLTASRPGIMFVVCACARFQVTPKVLHLHAMKRMFRYLKGQSKLGLWYPRDSPFDLEAFSNSDYAGTSLDRKSTTRGVMDPKSDA
ncbi:ribonuclease H-like domain-containing protein [Tanacetum coccineum]